MSIDRLNSIIGITAAARLCGLSERWLRHLADTRRIPMVRDSLGRRFFDRAEVLKFARAREKHRQGRKAATQSQAVRGRRAHGSSSTDSNDAQPSGAVAQTATQLGNGRNG
jgi:DNA-binding transcriptional MerR regulator